MENIGLVLEGGGMRGVYTAGVLDFLMEKDLYFQYVIGVSAGACNATSYLSRQKGRNRKVMIDYVDHPTFLGLNPIMKERSVFGMKLIFEDIPKKYEPFDFESFFNSKQKFVIATTDCEKGEPYYIEKDDIKQFSFKEFRNNKMLHAVRASSSLPFITPYVEFNSKKLLDGGIVDPIPIKKAQEDGFIKNVIILTRDKDYRKEPVKYADKITKRVYNEKLSEVVKDRYKKYNETLDYIGELETDGNAFVIRPSKQINLDKFEKDKNKLEEVYLMGYKDALIKFNELQSFIEKDLNKTRAFMDILNYNNYKCLCC